MSKLSERISELMQENNLDSKMLAEIVKVNPSAINHFLRGVRTPRFSCFINLLLCFNCSADYLLGLTDIHTEQTLHPVPPFSERLRAVLKERNVSQAKLIRELPVSASLVYKWLHDINEPLTDHLVRLSVYFDCTVDYLIGRIH